jgi:hypothetical protein
VNHITVHHKKFTHVPSSYHGSPRWSASSLPLIIATYNLSDIIVDLPPTSCQFQRQACLVCEQDELQ